MGNLGKLLFFIGGLILGYIVSKYIRISIYIPQESTIEEKAKPKGILTQKK